MELRSRSSSSSAAAEARPGPAPRERESAIAVVMNKSFFDWKQRCEDWLSLARMVGRRASCDLNYNGADNADVGLLYRESSHRKRRLKTPAACSSIDLGEETARHVAHHQPQPACALVEEM